MDELESCVSKAVLNKESIYKKKDTIIKLLHRLNPDEKQKSDITVIQKAVHYLMYVYTVSQDHEATASTQHEVDNSEMFMPKCTDLIFHLPVASLYCYMTYYRRWVKPSDFFLGMHDNYALDRNFPKIIGRQIFENIKSIITLCASLYEPSRYVIYKAIVNAYRGDQEVGDRKYKHLLIYMMVDIGLHPIAKRAFEIKHVKSLSPTDQCNCMQTLTELYTKALCNPLTLKQLSRLAIRSCMREVQILTDCYKLILPKALQNYISFSFLNAQVRHWLLTPDQRYKQSYSSADLIQRVCKNYGVKPPLNIPDLTAEYCTHEVTYSGQSSSQSSSDSFSN